MKVKYCGLQKCNDVTYAAKLGCDAVGFVMVPGSRREVTMQQAQILTEHTRQFDMVSVILLANATATRVSDVIRYCQPDIVQFHGQESPEFCQKFSYPYWKAVPMLTVNDWRHYIEAYEAAEHFVLDTYGGSHSGGSGQSFQWFKMPLESRNRLILAGGLNLQNVTRAVAETGAEFIDVSSGIEETAGVKSHTLMKQFMQTIKS